MTKDRTYLLICLAVICLLAIQMGQVLSAETSLDPSAFLILSAGFSVWILPGLLLGEYLAIESDDFATTISLSIAGSMLIGVLSILMLLLFQLKVSQWAVFLCASQIFALLGLVQLYLRRGSLVFVGPVFQMFSLKTYEEKHSLAVFGIAVVGLTFSYNVGENLFLLGNETALHLQFTRFYHQFSFSLDELALVKGFPPANLIHFWEYQIAVWSTMSGTDPLVLFLRARCLLPFVGFIALFFFVRNVFQSDFYRYGVYWGAVVLSFGLLNLQSPSSLSWIVETDKSRFLTSFMGTVHHSDSGMDILLPLGCGLLLYALRHMSGKIWCLLFGFLVAALFWHVREFLQLGIHFIFLSVVGVLALKSVRKSLALNWVAIVGAFLIISGGFLYNGSLSQSDDNPIRGYPEMKIKEVALEYMFEERNLLGFRSLFNFPLHIIPSVFAKPDEIRSSDYMYWKFMNISQNLHVDYWLVLCAFSILIIGLWGTYRGKLLARFFFLTWFCLFSWNSSMLFFIIATYSELLITIPRMLTTFSAILVATAGCVLYEKLRILSEKKSSQYEAEQFNVMCYLSVLVFGYVIFNLLNNSTVIINGYRYNWELILFSLILSALAWTGFIFSFIRTPVSEKRELSNRGLGYKVVLPAAGLFLFTMPALGGNYLRYFEESSYHSEFTVGIFEDGNAYGYSRKLIDYLRAMPVGATFAPSDPTDSGMVSVFAPLRQLSNNANLVNMNFQTVLFREKKHPLFNLNEILARGENDLEMAHDEILKFLASGNSEYVLLQDKNYQSLKWYFEVHREDYDFVFHNNVDKELIIKIIKPL